MVRRAGRELTVCECTRSTGTRWRRSAVLAVLGALAALAAVPTHEAAGQENPLFDPLASIPEVAQGPVAAVPFGPGERLEYQVKLGIVSAGEGFLAVEGIETVRGHETYRLAMGLKGGVLFAKVNDLYTSWLDTRSLASRHFIRDVHEVNYKSFREWAIHPERGFWERVDEDESERMDAIVPLDELAFIFWLRTLPLEVGETYTYTNYFKNEGNPVVIKVLRKERKKVPAGEFDTIVVQPIIKTKGLFSQGGKAEVYLTDDEDRYLVYLRSEIPIVGSVTLHLRGIEEGVPLVSGGGVEASSSTGAR